jgi:prevent-host-death family protein
MKVAVSELKARLAKYLRLTKSGEIVEIRERGVPIAVLRPIPDGRKHKTIAPRKDPSRLGRMRFSVKPKKLFDITQLLLEDRKKR